MDWKHWVILGLVVFTAGWMLFDGARALIVGDYVTPKAGEYAGQLGPWSNLVATLGIEPRSTLMKSIFVVYGFITLAVAASFALGFSRSRVAIAVVCILGLWYLPFGTVANVIALVLLWIGRN